MAAVIKTALQQSPRAACSSRLVTVNMPSFTPPSPIPVTAPAPVNAPHRGCVVHTTLVDPDKMACKKQYVRACVNAYTASINPICSFFGKMIISLPGAVDIILRWRWLIVIPLAPIGVKQARGPIILSVATPNLFALCRPALPEWPLLG